MSNVRAQIERIIRSSSQSLPTRIKLQPYSWDLQPDLGSGFDQRSSMQQQIPRPSDPLSRGVICVFGERVGTPLEDSFPFDVLSTRETWENPEHKYRLRHPWPADLEEQKRALASGEFPLTGSIWEFLDAHAANQDGDLPLFLTYVADQKFSPDDVGISFGNKVVWKGQADRSDITAKQFSEWMEQTYQPQIEALRNFLGAVKQAGIALKWARSEESLYQDVRGFVVEKLLKLDSKYLKSPFKGLDFYDIEDGDLFFGRGDLTSNVVRTVSKIAECGKTAQFVGLCGPSGSGKSSVLRAGVLFDLQRLEQRGRFKVVAIRPTDLHGADGKPENVVPKLLTALRTASGLIVTREDYDRVLRAKSVRAVRELVDVIVESLNASDSSNRSFLVVGLDQFEEILDDLGDPMLKRGWKDFLGFIRHATETGRVLFVYTLESARTRAMRESSFAEHVSRSREFQVENGRNFWRAIITRPFEVTGLPLNDELVDELLDLVDNLMEGKSDIEVSALLPLLAIALRRIYENGKTAQISWSKQRQNSAQGRQDAKMQRLGESVMGFGDQFCIRRSDLSPEVLDIERSIGREAETAVRESGVNFEKDRRALVSFLRPFVRLTESDGSTVTLRAAPFPLKWAEGEAALAFRRHRLLIPAGSSLFRLVHEALLRHWSIASIYLKTDVDELRIEQELQIAAERWVRGGKKLRPTGTTLGRIADAAVVLDDYLRQWCFGSETITPDHVVLREYCLQLLMHSKAPTTTVRNNPDESTYTHIAAAYGRIDILKKFQTADADCLKRRRKDDRTPLGMAVWGQSETVKYLLDQDCFSAESEAGKSFVLHCAVFAKQSEILKQLLPHAKGILDSEVGNYTLVHQAAQTGQLDILRRMLELGLDPDAPDKKGFTPLHIAAMSGHATVVEFLAPMTDVDSQQDLGWTALHFAVRHAHLEVVEVLLDYVENINTPCGFTNQELKEGVKWSWFTPLHLAAQLSDPQNASALRNRPNLDLELTSESLVYRLLQEPALDLNRVDYLETTPLGYALECTPVRLLLLAESRLDPLLPVKKDGPTPLQLCARESLWGGKRWDVLTRMIDKVMASKGPHIVAEAIATCGLVQEGLAHGAPILMLRRLIGLMGDQVDTPGPGGFTPLMAAVKAGDANVIRILLEDAQADITSAGAEHGSPLIEALLIRTREELVRKLWGGLPGELSVRNQSGWTPLHAAAACDLDWAIDWLLEEGASYATQETDHWGRIPAQLASSRNQTKLGGAALDKESVNCRSWQADLDWKRVEGSTRGHLGDLLAAHENRDLRDERTMFEVAILPFYAADKVRMVRTYRSDRGIENWGYYFWLIKEEGDELKRLKGQSPVIHETNIKTPILVTPDHVLSYLRFFCFFVRGEDGPFLVLENMEQPEIPNLRPDEIEKVGQVARPAQCHGSDGEGNFRVNAVIYYSNAVFLADFLIMPNGMLEMKSDYPLVAELSASAIAPIM